MTASQTILRYLADLAPAGRRTTDVVNRKSEFVWLGGQPSYLYTVDESPARSLPKSPELRRLVAVDSLSPSEQLLRLGWLFVTGTVDNGGKSARYCLPLLSVPVRLRDFGLAYQLVIEGNIEMPDGFFDWDARLELEDSTHPFAGGSLTDSDQLVARLPKMAAWVNTALERAGLPPGVLRGGDVNPADLREQPGLNVVAGAAIYTNRDVFTPDAAGVLRTWSHQSVETSALAALYGDADNVFRERRRDVRSPLPLNCSQREALRRLGKETITVVSGPPGTGKSHLVAAAAIDQIAHGRSVLIATQSGHATSVVAELLERYPGPRFVRFGNRDDRETVAAELADGLAIPLSPDDYRRLEARAERAGDKVRRLHKTIALLLEREASFAAGLQSREINLLAATQTPAVLSDDFDLAKAERLRRRARDGTAILNRWSKARALKKLRALVGSDTEASLDDIDAGLEAARAERAVQRGLSGGGLSLVQAWDELESAESEHRRASGELIEAERRSRENSRRKSTRAVATLASALRAGRARRRQLLRELDAGDFLDVLPLWIGTLQEIDDTLPVVPAAFDLVIFDEASQIDQMRAAPALARAKRAMIVGDPRQLRHVSFVADDAMRDTAAKHALEPRRARLLDVRRNSLFDVGAAASNITWLDEHFRSVPHIIRFSDRTFYGGNLRLMTQHPRNETRDAIHTVPVTGTRNGQGVNQAEVDEALRQIARYSEDGATSIGVISPFRPQADALEEAIIATYGPEDISRLGLRSGTVHAFQGSERDVVIASLAIDGDATGGSLNFLQNPNLFNVLVTRAKREMVIITSVAQSSLPAGLLADYLRHAEHAPHGAETAMAGSEWASDLMAELRVFGFPVVASYPVAGWSVDLTVGDGVHAIGVETTVHPSGPEQHIEQHLALRRAGWDMIDAFQSRWLTDAAGAAEMLSKQVLKRQRVS